MGVVTKSGSNRVIRGGSWNNNPQNLRSANRNNNSPDNRNNNVGFRLLSTSGLPVKRRLRIALQCN
jgi:formylglycine-generating enzyme required for sulfatase activity